ncbi:atp-binding cassette sub-family b [Holotrichia oblita]|nr:atp-binding cassette sub-family b [Holotrichia oblita]
MLKLLKRLKAWQWLLIVAVIAIVVTQVLMFDLELPNKMGTIIAAIRSGANISELTKIGGEMLLIVFGSTACTVIAGFMTAFLAATFSNDLRRDMFVRINEFSSREINKFSTPSLITRTTNDISQVAMVVIMVLRFAVSAPVMAGGAIYQIVGKSRDLSLVTATAVGVMFVLIISLLIIVLPKFRSIQKLTDKLNSVARENLTGLRVVRAYNAEKLEQEKFNKANVDVTKTNLFVNRAFAFMPTGMQFVATCMGLTITWMGAYLIADNKVAFENLAVFMQYSMQILMSFMMLTMVFFMVPRAAVSGQRINEILTTFSSIVDGTFDGDTVEKGVVEFKNVSFKYPDADEYVLKNISLKINKGEMVAFIGSTGSGKSTLINLVARLFDASEGEVTVDGVDVKQYKLKTLYSKLGYVPQRGVLFSGTIADNIRYGKQDATETEIWNAIDIAQAGDFVRELDGGLSYHIAQGGKNVSGGQKQRLSIARAIIKRPEIYIFDDSFSALDYKTDKALRERLKAETKEATNLIVAQRIGTRLNADKIVVLENGGLVDAGKHSELLERCKVYQEIAYSQLNKEELI